MNHYLVILFLIAAFLIVLRGYDRGTFCPPSMVRLLVQQ